MAQTANASPPNLLLKSLYIKNGRILYLAKHCPSTNALIVNHTLELWGAASSGMRPHAEDCLSALPNLISSLSTKSIHCSSCFTYPCSNCQYTLH